MKYLPNLTGIRFLLATMVVLFHIPQFCKNRGLPFNNSLPIFNKGTEAVYLFFCLSGFLIIRILYQKKKKGVLNLLEFYRNRVLRIFPLYYLILSFGFLYYRIILPKIGFNIENNYNLLEAVVLGFSCFANILKTYSPGGILEILWSIAIEEQFYLIIAPLLFFVPSKRVKIFLGLITTVFFGLFFSHNLLLLEKWNMCFYYFSFSGLISIMLLESNLFFQSKMFRLVVYSLTVIYFFTSYFQFLGEGFYYHLVTTILFSFFLGCLSVKPVGIFENKTMRYLGSISYGIYMYHAIVMNFFGFVFLEILPERLFNDVIFIGLFIFLVLGFTVLVAHYSYKYYESYFLRKKNSSLSF